MSSLVLRSQRLSRSLRCGDLVLPRLSNPQSRQYAVNAAALTGLQKSDKKHKTTTDPSARLAKAKAPSLKTDANNPITQATVKTDNASHASKQKGGLVQPTTDLEMLDVIEQLQMAQHVSGLDVWASPVGVFDLHIPGSSGGMAANANNWFKNAVSMWTMAAEDSFPGSSVKSKWSSQIFRVQSTKWLAPFRQNALSNYLALQKAVATGDTKTIDKFASDAYNRRLKDMIRGRDPSRIYAWTYHGEKKPCKVVSIRAQEFNMAKEAPKIGNRLVVQALVRFDTLQSLQVYSKQRTLLHGDGQPKPVVEYLVFQKRMWYDGPFVIRDQLYEGLETKARASA